MTTKLKIKSKFTNFFKLMSKPFSAGIVKRTKIENIKGPFIGKKVFNKINKFPKNINPNKG
jgi:hypothetical protein